MWQASIVRHVGEPLTQAHKAQVESEYPTRKSCGEWHSTTNTRLYILHESGKDSKTTTSPLSAILTILTSRHYWWPVPQEAQRTGRLDQRAVHPGEYGKAEKEMQAGVPTRQRQTMTGLRHRSWLPIVMRSLGGGKPEVPIR